MQGELVSSHLSREAVISDIIPCPWEQFYEDDLSDQCTVMAFRMLVKDLLVLVQAVNEGVVNLLGKKLIASFPTMYIPIS